MADYRPVPAVPVIDDDRVIYHLTLAKRFLGYVDVFNSHLAAGGGVKESFDVLSEAIWGAPWMIHELGNDGFGDRPIDNKLAENAVAARAYLDMLHGICVRMNVAVDRQVVGMFEPVDGEPLRVVVRALEGWVRERPADTHAGGKYPGVAQRDDEAGAIKPTGTANKSERQLEWLAQAMLLVRDHPDWSNAAIAKSVGKNPSTLSRSPTYQAAAAMARSDKSGLRRGHVTVDSETGSRDVDASYCDPEVDLDS